MNEDRMGLYNGIHVCFISMDGRENLRLKPLFFTDIGSFLYIFPSNSETGGIMVIYMNPLLEELLDRYSMLPVWSNFQTLTSDFVFFFFGIEHLKILGVPNFDPYQCIMGI